METILTDRQAHWLNTVFAAKASQRGRTVRRALRDVEAMVGREVFLAEVQRRGWSAVENAGQIIVFCNDQPIRRVV
ncbi:MULTISPECIES: N-(5'-phosphoribosyl)anthranilate isomerase [Jannaschia]|uniref:N-(5'-phosphoribosyl)anthranilate isomerase n=1 Tax=Jannaschia TaxID=188905 RepID=UPI001C7DA566|nr:MULTISPECIES: N-(5'-phosphoribosyl)anthranilate isomerase [unclassified Jannaschia]